MHAALNTYLDLIDHVPRGHRLRGCLPVLPARPQRLLQRLSVLELRLRGTVHRPPLYIILAEGPFFGLFPCTRACVRIRPRLCLGFAAFLLWDGGGDPVTFRGGEDNPGRGMATVDQTEVRTERR